MNDVYGVLGTPGVGFFSLLIIGGIAGSFVGSTLATTAGIAVNGSLGRLLAAVVGAVILVYGWRMLRARQNPPQQQGGYGNQPGGYGNQPGGYDEIMPPNDGRGGPQGQYGNQQGQYGNQQGQYGKPQGQHGEPRGEWINEPPPGDNRNYDNPPRDPNSPLDRR